jgi:two-component system, cell cycle sensor histidine kinase and response regulator CckA
MPEPRNDAPFIQDLRSLAEQRLRATPQRPFHGTAESLSQELSVHRAELELQNDELRRIADELQHTKDRYYDLYDLAPVGYLALGPTGRIDEANRTAATMLGTVQAKLGGTSLRRFVGPEGRETLRDHLHATFSHEGTHACELEIRRPGGTTFRVQLESTSRSRGGATSMATRTILFDVTDQRRAEAEARDWKLKVAAVEQELRQARGTDTLGRAVAGVAHDLNNLLNVVVGYATEALLTAGEGDDPTALCVQQSRRAALAAADLVGQLSDLARLEPDKAEQVDLDAAVRRLAGLVDPLLSGTQVALSLSTDGAHVLGPRGSLDRIVLNLTINAHDAMPDGGHLTLETRLIPREGAETPFLRLTVKDTGRGMDDEVLAHLFDPFFTTKPGRGSGLGLTTVQQLVEQMGGQLHVQSRVGAGTEFTVDLPVCNLT